PSLRCSGRPSRAGRRYPAGGERSGRARLTSPWAGSAPCAFQSHCASPDSRARALRETPAPRAAPRSVARGRQRVAARLASPSARSGLFPPEPSRVPASVRLASVPLASVRSVLVRLVLVRLAPAGSQEGASTPGRHVLGPRREVVQPRPGPRAAARESAGTPTRRARPRERLRRPPTVAWSPTARTGHAADAPATAPAARARPPPPRSHRHLAP